MNDGSSTIHGRSVNPSAAGDDRCVWNGFLQVSLYADSILQKNEVLGLVEQRTQKLRSSNNVWKSSMEINEIALKRDRGWNGQRMGKCR